MIAPSPQIGVAGAVRHPWPFRLFNRAGPALRRLPFEFLSLSPDRLIAEAVSRTGLDDFGARDFETGLAVLTASAERDARLTPIGRIALRQHILSALTTRLLEEDLRKRAPVPSPEADIRPIVIVGLPRSGTTLLHRLLALAPQTWGLAYWEVRNPLRPRGPDRRLRWAKRQLALLDLLAPGFKTMHEVSAEAPEECWFLLDSSLVSATFWMTAPVHGYLDWYLKQDPSPGYSRYREHLLRFSAARPGERLVLKAPIHTLNLAALRRALPEAAIIQIHRDPVACVNSVNSLVRELRGAVTDHLDTARVGQANLDLLVRASERCVDDRDGWRGEPVIDVFYEDLVADPRQVLRDLLERMGRSFSPEHEARVARYLKDNPPHRHGVHRYRSSDFMLDDDRIRDRFDRYLQRFPRLRHRTHPPADAASGSGNWTFDRPVR